MLVRNQFTHDSRVEKEARTLAGAGYAVTVVAEQDGALPASETRDTYDVVRVRRGAARAPILRFLQYRSRLIEALIATQPQILHAHDSDALGPVAAVAGRLRIPFVYDAHDLWLGRPRRGRTRTYFALAQAFYALLEWRLVPLAAAWLTVTIPIARHLERRYRIGPVQVVANYPELSGLEDAAERPLDLRALPGGSRIPPGPIVLYLGGLMAGRGLESLVTAVSTMPANAQLVLLGQGALGPALRELAEAGGLGSRVHILPPVAPDQVVSAAAGASIGVSPYVASSLNNRYSLPNKLFQYMAAGIPVVASDFPQVREVIERSGAGRCVDTSDPAAIGAAVSAILNDPAVAATMGAAGRRAIESRFNWEVAAESLLAIYRGVSAEASARGGQAR
jgi:glycosyltransferase involved in cell wall biosynthesis